MKEIKDNGVVKFAFYLFGIGGLLAWNTILSIFDFFIHFQGKYSPEFIYPNMNFVLNVVFQFIILFTKKRWTYKIQLLISLLISLLSMIFIPISVIFVGGLGSFIITSGIILFQGLANAILLSCFYSIISFLPFEYIIAFSTGQGIAGIMMNVARYIILLSLGDPNDETNIIVGSLIFFFLAAFITAICIVFVFITYKNPYFISQMRTSGEFPIETYSDFVALTNDSAMEKEKEKMVVNSEQLSEKTKDSINENGSDGSFKTLMVLLLDINFMVMISFIFTFAVFPGVSIAQPFFNVSTSYKVNTINFIFNICDTIGRKFPDFLPLTKNKFYVMALLRCVFIFTFPLTIILAGTFWVGITTLSIITCLNMILLAFTNGYLASTSFSLAPEQVPGDLKGKSGSSLSFFLVIGIFTGSLYATFIMQNFI